MHKLNLFVVNPNKQFYYIFWTLYSSRQAPNEYRIWNYVSFRNNEKFLPQLKWHFQQVLRALYPKGRIYKVPSILESWGKLMLSTRYCFSVRSAWFKQLEELFLTAKMKETSVFHFLVSPIIPLYLSYNVEINWSTQRSDLRI